VQFHILTAKPEPYECITNMVVQFVLDMHFLKQVSLYGKFLSRITHQLIGCVIERACSAFAATGADPSRFLSLNHEASAPLATFSSFLNQSLNW
jgi:hypothetical protein